jgi:hypothetical protein
MTPVPSQEPLQQRIYRELAAELTARLEGQELSWPAVHAAERRRQARVRLTIARGLEASNTYPGVAAGVVSTWVMRCGWPSSQVSVT